MPQDIQIISSQNINPSLWNDCVIKHQTPIYCRYEYLSTMAKNWSGLILGDYKAVMPICYKRKYGIKYCYTPAFMQQLGWVGEPIHWQELEKVITQFVKYGDVMFNWKNDLVDENAIAKTNFIISLEQSYDKISSQYNSDLEQNLKKANKENLIYKSSIEIPQAIHYYKQLYADRLEKTTQQDFENLLSLCSLLNEANNCIVRKVCNNDNELLAIALLLKDENRIYNIANSTTSLGKKSAANHFLIDNILKEFSNTDLIFDFEGSDLPGVKSFYENFGAINQPYYHVHINKLWFLPKNF